MVKTKATPGKRYCKKCQKLIPIHCRVCTYCSAPQYTMQQITKEYKKRHKFTQQDPYCSFESLLLKHNPFETRYKSPVFYPESASIQTYLTLSDLKININTQEFTINPFSHIKFGSYFFINPCGKANLLAFSYGSPTFLCLSMCNSDLHYGKIYVDEGLVQVWEFGDTPQYKYSFLHNGHTALSMSFLPVKLNKNIGTLAVSLANGDICIYNLPNTEGSLLYIPPISVYKIAGLVFSCLAWTKNANIVAGTQDGSIFYMKPGHEPNIKIYNAHKLPITSILYCHNSDTVISTGLDGCLKAWDSRGKLVDNLCLSKRWSYHICNNPLGKYLFYDNDAAISPHKVIKFDDRKLESKKQLSQSTEATLWSCFSALTNFVYTVTAEGVIESIYVSELEKNSKKRKTPWKRYERLLWFNHSENKVLIGKYIPDRIASEHLGSIKCIDLVNKNNDKEIIAWAGDVCGFYEFELDSINKL